jgi:hypothetical protein
MSGKMHIIFRFSSKLFLKWWLDIMSKNLTKKSYRNSKRCYILVYWSVTLCLKSHVTEQESTHQCLHHSTYTTRPDILYTSWLHVSGTCSSSFVYRLLLQSMLPMASNTSTWSLVPSIKIITIGYYCCNTFCRLIILYLIKRTNIN